MLHTQLAPLALAVTALAISGCGGSSKTTSTATATSASATTTGTTTTAAAPASSSESGTTKALTRAELIAKANAICARVKAKGATITVTTRQDYVTLLPSLVTYLQTAVAEMSKLTPPASLANDWQTIVADNRTLAETAGQIVTYANANDLKATSAIVSTLKQTGTQLANVTRRDGFTSCTYLS